MRDEFGRFVKGHTVPNEWKDKFSDLLKGNALHTTPHSEETKLKISKSTYHSNLKGENNSNWKGGISTERNSKRNSTEYKHWRTSVFKRDNFTCQKCGNTKEYLHAHHLKPFSEEMDNFDVCNGLTVCYKCHEAIHGIKFGKGSKK